MSTPTSTNTSRVTDKGQTTIPKELREKHGIEPGDTVVWEESDDGLVVRTVVSDAGRGMLVDEDLDRESREAIADALAEEIRNRRESEWAVE